jgi:hypothetical protein
MSVLKQLTFTAVPRATGLSPEQNRRNKLIAHLREQLAMAQADAEGRLHVVKKRRWEYSDDGQKHLIEVDKRLKQWWRTQNDGSVILTVRYGSRPLEFDKGKQAIALRNRDELTALIPKLIAATEAGELDGMISTAMRGRPAVNKRAA